MVRARQRSQAVVEFGIIALLFTLLIFAVIDFGLLLNTWLAVSSGSRELARDASTGKNDTFLLGEASALDLPSISTAGFAGGLCCGADSAVEVKVEYFTGSEGTPPPPLKCPPWQSGCNSIGSPQIMQTYPAGDLGSTGGCPVTSTSCRPLPDDEVQVTVIAHGAQVITPLVRPFFGCTNGSNPQCHVNLTSVTTMRYEGAEF